MTCEGLNSCIQPGLRRKEGCHCCWESYIYSIAKAMVSLTQKVIPFLRITFSGIPVHSTLQVEETSACGASQKSLHRPLSYAIVYGLTLMQGVGLSQNQPAGPAAGSVVCRHGHLYIDLPSGCFASQVLYFKRQISV